MSLQPGQMLLRYRLVEKVGQGGMGVVWKAVDTTLDREAAVKILPGEFAADPMRLSRFEREAKLLASLNHPNIATVHSIDEADGVRFLAMEYVDGEDLAQQLTRGPLPLGEALATAIQIAEALQAAHDAGVIHRDLKPANIRVTPAGRVKVLDFGLGKAVLPAGGPGSGVMSPSLSPTMTATGSVEGTVLGTAPYMSPEQVRGRPLDRRTDVWSFGVVLFEALAGRHPFPGETAGDSIAAILEREPAWSVLPPGTPSPVRHVLRRCLEKDRERRLRDMGDVRLELQAAGEPPIGADPAPPPPRRSGWPLTAALLVGLALGVASGWLARGTSVPAAHRQAARFAVDLSAEGLRLETDDSNLAFDPSGELLAFAAVGATGQQVFVRALGDREVRAVPGTEGGTRPFFSPDGRWLAFIRAGKLMKVFVEGGPALTICDACEAATDFADPVWLDDGTIAYVVGATATTVDGVDAEGGKPRTLARAEVLGGRPTGERKITGFDSPVRVPGQPYFLASVFYDVTIEDYDVVAISPNDGSVRWVLQNATEPRFVPPDRLYFSRESSLYEASFDPRRGVVTGEPRRIVDGLLTNIWSDNAQYAVSADGSLAYVPGRRKGPGRQLIRVSIDGDREPLMDGSDAFMGELRVSPDGRSVLLTTLRRKAELWSFDRERRSLALVNNEAPVYSPVWTPDGREVIYQREGYGDAPTRIIRQGVDGGDPGRPIELVSPAPGNDGPSSVSPDGKILLLQRFDPLGQRRRDIMMFRMGMPEAAEPLVATPADESGARFSPDGKWFAYESDESGRAEVHVRGFPDAGRRWQVSVDGGREPRWSWKGDALFFLGKKGLFRARVHADGGFRVEPPVKLFDLDVVTPDLLATYDVLPDGGFVMIEPAPWEAEGRWIEIVNAWLPRPAAGATD